MKKILLLLCSISVLMSSCIKDEGPDKEFDIISFTIEGEAIVGPVIKQDINKIYIMVNLDSIKEFSSRKIVPKIEISKGAVVIPASGEEVTLKDYATQYKVVAQDGAERIYSVVFTPYVSLGMNFEDWYDVQHGKNEKRIYELPTDPLWVNANPGVAILYRDTTDFPTRRSTDKYPGSSGKYSAVLKTVYGNKNMVVDMMNIPVYAGNMFRGEFDAGMAMMNPLLTTKFGQPHPEYAGKPSKLTAWYKYESGKKGFTTWEYSTAGRKTKIISVIKEKLDEPDIYAVLYKVEKSEVLEEVFLTASDIKTSGRTVATAYLEDRSEKADWTRLEIPFTYREELNYGLYDYKLAIVFSSSVDGANYRGAIGSILTIDDLEVECVAIK